MTIEAIRARSQNEQALYEAAVKIRTILDDAAKAITLPDDRDACEEILELVQGEDD